MSSSYDVRVWAIRIRRNRPNPYQVRWRVGTASPFAKSFRTSALADSFRSELIAATRRGEEFDTDTGLPVSQTREQTAITWYEHAIDYIDMKWPGAAGKSRISIVETLTAVTPVLVRSDHGAPDEAILRVALRRWAFNPAHRHDEMPAEIRAALAWLRRTSLPITALRDDKAVRRVLDVLAIKLDGTPASPDYLGRRRRVLYNVLSYAVREKRLPENPLDSTAWEAPDVSVEEINPRVVASPEQVRELLAAVSYIGPRRGDVSWPSSRACTSPCSGHRRRQRCAPTTVRSRQPAGAAWTLARLCQRPASSGPTQARGTNTAASRTAPAVRSGSSPSRPNS